jgi:hypothetical protein
MDFEPTARLCLPLLRQRLRCRPMYALARRDRPSSSVRPQPKNKESATAASRRRRRVGLIAGRSADQRCWVGAALVRASQWIKRRNAPAASASTACRSIASSKSRASSSCSNPVGAGTLRDEHGRADPQVSPRGLPRTPATLECHKVRWHCVIGKEAGDDLPQPLPLLGDGLMHSSSQLPLNLFELRLHAVASFSYKGKSRSQLGIAGRPLLDAPRTDPYVRISRIRLPPWVFDGEAVAGPGVKDARCREKVVRQLLDPFPREAILLAR